MENAVGHCLSNTLRSSSRGVATLALIAGIVVSPAGGQEQTPEQARAIEALSEWAKASHLTAEWQFPRQLRQAGHPAGQGDAWTLDVRFLVPPGERGEDREYQRFEQFLARYQADQGLSFPDKLFYKFIQIFDLKREEAAVHFQVGSRDFAAFVDPSSGALVFQPGSTRFDRESDIVKVPQVLSKTRSLAATVQKPAVEPDWPGKVRAFLEDYFRNANRRDGLPEPRIYPDCSGNHVGLKVSGLRGQALPDGKYWEKIQLEIDVWKVPEGIQLSANIDGAYAAGLRGAAAPSDYPEYMDHDYPNQLRDFSKTLFDKLKRALATGTP